VLRLDATHSTPLFVEGAEPRVAGDRGRNHNPLVGEREPGLVLQNQVDAYHAPDAGHGRRAV
jgi:hypothetical protein